MRITGGVFRSRALKAPKGSSTRPTSDRVREALFSALASGGLLDDAPRVLDLYAGTGALAFEALSRGASSAVLVEHARDALAVIRENARALDVERRVEIIPSRVDRALARVRGPFDVVFADPPYADVPTSAFAAVLEGAAHLVGSGGALVLEHGTKDAPPAIAGLELDRSREYGDTTLTLYRKPVQAPEAPPEAPEEEEPAG